MNDFPERYDLYRTPDGTPEEIYGQAYSKDEAIRKMDQVIARDRAGLYQYWYKATYQVRHVTTSDKPKGRLIYQVMIYEDRSEES